MVRTLVRGFLGQPGSGKTYAMSALAAEWRRKYADLPIFSTYELYLPGVVLTDPPWDGEYPLRDAANGLLLLDEAAQIMDARLYGRTPIDIIHKMMQCRKYRLETWWSTQHQEYVDKRLKLITFESWHMGCFDRIPLLGGYFATIRFNINGRAIGFRWIRKSKRRDNLYDSWGKVSLASFYEAAAYMSSRTGTAASPRARSAARAGPDAQAVESGSER